MNAATVAVRRKKPARRRPPSKAAAKTASRSAPEASVSSTLPFLLDFFPLEGPQYTGLTPFYEALKAGRWVTTRCPRDGRTLWPPRVVCPHCHGEGLEWVDLPRDGHLYAFSAVLAGAPLGMESDVPFVVGLVDLNGSDLRVFGRVLGKGWMECRVGEPVRVEPYQLPDGRYFFRFRTTG